MLVEERFDLVGLKDHYFTKPVQSLLQVLTSDELKHKALELGGYDVRAADTVAFPG